MGVREREYQERLVTAHEARLAELEVQEARLGYGAPPEVTTEIGQIRASIARLKDALDAPLSKETVQALTPDDRYQGHIAWQMRMEEAVYEFRREVREMRRILYVFCGGFLVLATYVVARGLS